MIEDANDALKDFPEGDEEIDLFPSRRKDDQAFDTCWRNFLDDEPIKQVAFEIPVPLSHEEICKDARKVDEQAMTARMLSVEHVLRNSHMQVVIEEWDHAWRVAAIYVETIDELASLLLED